MSMYRALFFMGVIASVPLLMLSGCRSVQPKTDAPTVQPVSAEQIPQQPPEMETKSAVEGVPVLAPENPVHDFGQMGPGGRNTCEFKFKNTGTQLLVIDTVLSTCGCTIPELTKKEYAPGEEGVIHVTFTAPTIKTGVEKHIYVVSNDPKTPETELTIQAEVVINVEVTPENVELRLNQDNAGMPSLVVKSLDDEPFSIQRVTVSPQDVMTVPFDQTEEMTAFLLTPQVNKEMLSEMPDGTIQILTSHPKSGILLVRYHAIPEYEVSRPRIILQDAIPGESVVKEDLIRSNYDKDVEYASAVSRNGYMEVESYEKDGKHLRLQIKITPPEEVTASTYITDELKVTLKDGKVLSIRCAGWYKRS